jgi:hypothetical protein
MFLPMCFQLMESGPFVTAVLAVVGLDRFLQKLILHHNQYIPVREKFVGYFHRWCSKAAVLKVFLG